MEITNNFLPGISHFHIQAFFPLSIVLGSEIWNLRTRCPEVNEALLAAGSQLLPVLPAWLLENTLSCLLPAYLGLKIKNPDSEFVLAGRNRYFKQRRTDGSVAYCQFVWIVLVIR